MSHTDHHIAIYADGMATIDSLRRSLTDTFNDKPVSIITINKDDVLNGDYPNERTLAFFMPGTPGGSSAYRDQLGHSGLGKIRRYVERGGVYAGICAGAYIACTEFEYYDKHSDTTKNVKPPLRFFDAKAIGPVRDYVDTRDKDNPWADYSVVQVEFKTAAGDTDKAGVCYSGGPFMHADEASGDPDTTIIARYDELPDKPVAIARRLIGDGKALFIGVVPEISGKLMFRQINPRCPYRHFGESILKDLSALEDSRQRLWNRIIADIPSPRVSN